MDKLVSLLSSDIVLGWDLCPCPVDLGGGGGGDLLSVSISDLVRSLGSTKGWVPFFPFSDVCCSLFSFPFHSVLGKLSLARDSVQPSGISL